MTEPVRTCVACRTRRPQRALLRLRRRSDGVVVPAVGRRDHQRGRSAYVCASTTCVERAVQRRAIERSLSRRGAVAVRCPTADVLGREVAAALDHEITNLQRSGEHSRGPRYDALEELRRGLREPGRSA